MGVVAWNAANSITTQVAVDGLLDSLCVAAPEWIIIYISEMDGYRAHDRPADSELEFHQHYTYRHWAGEGSFSSLIIVNKNSSYLLRQVCTAGRAMRVDLSDGLNLHQSFIGLHGAHGDRLSEALADVARFAKTRPLLYKITLIGDYNADMLLVHHQDPYTTQQRTT